MFHALPERAVVNIVDEVATMAFNLRASQYTLVAGCVIWLYDVSLTLQDEVSLLWTRGGAFVKLLYLINRYLPAVGLTMAILNNNPIQGWFHTEALCSAGFTILTLCQAIEVVVATTIFTVRLYTIHFNQRRVQYFLIAALLASHACVFILATLVISKAIATMNYSEALRMCVALPTSALGGLYLTPIFMESIIAFFTLVHAAVYHTTKLQTKTTPTRAILNALYMDGFAYYVMIISLRLGTCLVYWKAPESLILVMCYLEYSLTSVLTSRWFLSFRKVLLESKRTVIFETKLSTSFTGATIQFAGHGGLDCLVTVERSVVSTSKGSLKTCTTEVWNRSF